MIELEQIIKEELFGVNNKKIKEENLKEYLTSLKKEELIKMAISQTFIDKNYFDLYKVNNLKNKAKKEIIDYITEKLDKILESFIKIIKTEEIEQLENVIKNNGKKILFDDLKVSIRFILLLKNFSLAKVEYNNKEDSLKIFMPKEFVDIFNNCFKNKKLLELNNYNNKVYNYVRDVINTYGIVTLDKLYELFESQMFKIDKKDLKHIIEIVTIYEEEHIYEYNGETLLCSVEFGDEDYALYFYDSQKMDYKRYSKEDYKNISSFKYVEKLKAYKKIVDYELYITDKSSITLEELENICLKMKSEKNIKFVFIDNLLLLSKNSNKTNDELCTYLKQMALKLNISIFALSLDSENISKKE